VAVAVVVVVVVVVVVGGSITCARSGAGVEGDLGGPGTES
jgi:hypothetical protein